jgi:hypothetical protein
MMGRSSRPTVALRCKRVRKTVTNFVDLDQRTARADPRRGLNCSSRPRNPPRPDAFATKAYDFKRPTSYLLAEQKMILFRSAATEA